MKRKHPPYEVPDVVLLLGTDASGKDHVANILEAVILEKGGSIEKRKRFFSGRRTKERHSQTKGWADRAQESVFLRLYPVLGFLLPFLMACLVLADALLYGPAERKLLVVGYNPLRALAFYWAGKGGPKDKTLPLFLCWAFGVLLKKTGATVVVLDVDPQVRRRRLNSRLQHGLADRFDLYMLEDEQRSERIEACLIHGAEKLCGARLLRNNDLDENAIRALFVDPEGGRS